MMVPRAYIYASAPPIEAFDEKNIRRSTRKSVSPRPERTQAPRPVTPARTTTEPVRTPTKPVTVPVPERTRSAEGHSMPRLHGRASNGRITTTPHDSNALPPAVAALLAVTEIPRPKRSQFRRRSTNPRCMSIDELVNEWKNDDQAFSLSYSSSSALSVLLEDKDDKDELCPSSTESMLEESFLHRRTTSNESVPSLDTDDRSILSSGSPSTPESLRSPESSLNLKKEKSRSLPIAEDCAMQHPLILPLPEDEDPDDGLILSPPNAGRTPTRKPRPSLKSNLSSSLQALKIAAINSITSLTSSGASTPPQRGLALPISDDVLWSHPFLFPRLSSEIRPAIEGKPSKAQRRYLNPMPLTFEEQEAPYQLGLHAPYLAEQTDGAPTIQMQTYSRSRRKSAVKRGNGPDPQSEAGRALLGAAGVRQREVRENSDFLRIVVMEINMRRAGKLETGRARMWLPPREANCASESSGRIPARRVGESAY